ncbi:MAG TPA: site-2 protease family protein [Thermotogota bacterium]|nr:site-2 protease family protein [Thermotogota bacterium]HPJ88004.1 site-2 protease family protein [Thermotogota bacterium]HPR95091.1 site-2 protease family protein [Thermotogota bacterium]
MNFIRQLLVKTPAVLLALAFHEFVHAATAVRLGDDTAIRLKRYTLNPFKHIDPIGLACFLVFNFGWSRRIPINTLKLKNKNRDVFFIVMSAPMANFLIALITGFVFYGLRIHKYSWLFNPNPESAYFYISYFADVMGSFMVSNLVIAVFNMIPVMPLDGAEIWSVFNTSKYMNFVMKYQIYGILILLVTIIFGLAHIIMNPIIVGFNTMLVYLSGLF